MPPVKACPLDPAALLARFRIEAEQHGFREELMGLRDDFPLIAFTRRAVGQRPRIYVSSGVHGDEPAPPEALLQMLQSGIFDDRAHWFLIPMLNPSGFSAGRRENAEGVDLNRDYLGPKSAEIGAHIAWLEKQPRFDLSLCLHEDWEATGFYLYELSRPQPASLARSIRDAAAHHIPAEPAREIDGRPIDETAIIRPASDPLLRETWPESIYLFKHHVDLSYTFETPSGFPLPDRISAFHAAVTTAINAQLQPPLK
jgi:hypothetical protein